METFQKVMMIDDNEIDNLIHSRLVTELRFGRQVEAFSNGKSAILHLRELLRGHKQNLPDIIFVDLHMPIMDGWAFIQEYEKLSIHLYKDIPVYILTCAIYNKEVSKLKSEHIQIGFLPKPLTIEALEEISGKHLRFAIN